MLVNVAGDAIWRSPGFARITMPVVYNHIMGNRRFLPRIQLMILAFPFLVACGARSGLLVDDPGPWATGGGGTPRSGTMGGSTPSGSTPSGSTSSGIAIVVLEISINGGYTCARLMDATVRCWGSNQMGQIGDGTTTDRLTPTVVHDLAGVTQISAGAFAACAVMRDATLKCWGSNTAAQLGNGATAIEGPTPATVPGLSGVAQVSAGGGHVCARMIDSTVQCWGGNEDGQIGNGTGFIQRTPTAVRDLSGVAEISTGERESCALMTDRTVECWGGGGGPMLPTRITGLSEVEQISCGENYDCARLGDGTVWCWGSNEFGELGDGTTAHNRAVPTKVIGLSGVAEISAGEGHTCARLIDGGVACWGSNEGGALGDGTTIDRYTPTWVTGLSGVAAISAKGIHTCALLIDGSVRCWGLNDSGQIGDGTRTHRVVPTKIRW